MDFRPEVQEACDKLSTFNASDENFNEMRLIVHRNQLGERLDQTETDALIAALRADTHAEQLSFINCHHPGPQNSVFVDFIADTLIPSHPSLRYLTLAGNCLADEVTERIAESLKSNTRLLGFCFENNNLSDKGVRALAEVVRHNRCLRTIGIQSNGLGLHGCRMLVTSISANPNFKLLKGLWLAGNGIGVEGCKVIANFIPKAKSLSSLHLAENKIGDEGCQIITSALPEALSLEKLILCDNNISDLGCFSIADALQKNATLCTLVLRRNSITCIGAAALLASLQHVNFSVETLVLSGNEGVTDEKREQIDLQCNANLRIRRTVRAHLRNHLPEVLLSLCPKVLEAVGTKPDLIFHFVKAKPELFRERRAQRKRNRPERLQH